MRRKIAEYMVIFTIVGFWFLTFCLGFAVGVNFA